MKKHRISLIGPGAQGPKVSAQVLAKVLDLLVKACKGATRLRIDGRSTARGTPPAWLDKVSDFTVLKLEKGSVAIELEAVPIREIDPGLLAQQDLFTAIDGESSAFSLMKESLADVLAEDLESDKYDEGLVKTFAGFSTVIDDDVCSLQIDEESPVVVDNTATQTVKRLQFKTPPPQQVMLSGRLETIRHSDRMFMLITESGPQIRGLAEAIPATTLSDHFGKQVLVHGEAQFRPSGSLLRIEATQIEGVDEVQAALWAKVPRPLNQSVNQRDFAVAQGPRSGLNAVFGNWPGDESEEEFYAAMEHAK